MKKIIALALAIVMMAAVAVPAFAGQIENAQGENSTLVEYNVSEAYEVTIPETIYFAEDGDKDLVATLTIDVDNVKIAGGKALQLAVTSSVTAKSVDEKWLLKEKDTNGSSDVEYTVHKVTKAGDEVAKDEIFYELVSSVDAAGNSDTTALVLFTEGTGQVGIFRDSLTFTATVGAPTLG